MTGSQSCGGSANRGKSLTVVAILLPLITVLLGMHERQKNPATKTTSMERRRKLQKNQAGPLVTPPRKCDGNVTGYTSRLTAAMFVSLVTLMALAGTCRANVNKGTNAKSPLCYAFLQQGNLFVQCQDQRVQITRRGDVSDYAVSQTGMAIVLMRQTGTKSLGYGVGTPLMNVQIIPLKQGIEPRILHIGPNWGGLAASCGTVLFIYGTVRDIVNGGTLAFRPYFDFQCSSSRKEIAGQVELDSHGAVARGLLAGDDLPALFSGFPPNTTKPWLADTGSEGFGYSLSPNGKYLAYYMPKEMCVIEAQVTKACVPNINAFRDISVSDSGDTFFATHTNSTCYYKGAFHFSTVRRPGYDRAPCIGVAMLRKGKRTPVVIEPLARHPQWLTPEAGNAVVQGFVAKH